MKTCRDGVPPFSLWCSKGQRMLLPLGACPSPQTAELPDLYDPVWMDGLLVSCSQGQIERTSVKDETNSPNNRDV